MAAKGTCVRRQVLYFLSFLGDLFRSKPVVQVSFRNGAASPSQTEGTTLSADLRGDLTADCRGVKAPIVWARALLLEAQASRTLKQVGDEASHQGRAVGDASGPRIVSRPAELQRSWVVTASRVGGEACKRRTCRAPRHAESSVLGSSERDCR